MYIVQCTIEEIKYWLVLVIQYIYVQCTLYNVHCVQYPLQFDCPSLSLGQKHFCISQKRKTLNILLFGVDPCFVLFYVNLKLYSVHPLRSAFLELRETYVTESLRLLAFLSCLHSVNKNMKVNVYFLFF